MDRADEREPSSNHSSPAPPPLLSELVSFSFEEKTQSSVCLHDVDMWVCRANNWVCRVVWDVNNWLHLLLHNGPSWSRHRAFQLALSSQKVPPFVSLALHFFILLLQYGVASWSETGIASSLSPRKITKSEMHPVCFYSTNVVCGHNYGRPRHCTILETSLTHKTPAVPPHDIT